MEAVGAAVDPGKAFEAVCRAASLPVRLRTQAVRQTHQQGNQNGQSHTHAARYELVVDVAQRDGAVGQAERFLHVGHPAQLRVHEMGERERCNSVVRQELAEVQPVFVGDGQHGWAIWCVAPLCAYALLRR